MTPRMPLGTKASHCTACGRNFTTPANFDRHQKGTRVKPPVCVDPSEVGLVAVVKPWAAEVWQMPGRDDAPDEWAAT